MQENERRQDQNSWRGQKRRRKTTSGIPRKKARTRVPRDPYDPWGSSTDAEIEWSDGSDSSSGW
nr:MAG: ORF3 [Torque teno polar bear virus 41]